MPIRPSERGRYPKDWRKISLAVKRRADERCECRGECGEQHEAECWDGWQPTEQKRCGLRNYDWHPVSGARIVLTVAHLDHQPENCDFANLRAMCQRCHNRYDRSKRTEGIRKRRRDRLAVADIFDAQEANDA